MSAPRVRIAFDIDPHGGPVETFVSMTFALLPKDAAHALAFNIEKTRRFWGKGRTFEAISLAAYGCSIQPAAYMNN